MDIYRHTFWAIPQSGKVVLYITSALCLFLFLYGFYRRYRLWRQGRPSELSLARIRLVLMQRLSDVICQKRVREEKRSGRMHVLLSAGMVVLFLGTVLVFFDYDLQLHFLRGWFYLLFELVLDAFGLLFLLGTGLALFQRLPGSPGKRIARLRNTPLDYAILILLFVIGISGFVLEAMRLALTSPEHGICSFVGYALGLLLAQLVPLSAPLYLAMWVLHMLLSLTFVALIPYTKMMHLFLAPITVILTEPLTEMEVNPPFHLGLQSVDEIAAANHGLQGKTPRDFTFLQLLSLDACTECGRCDEVCPAALSGMPLAPRNIVIKLRGQMHKPDQPLTGFAEEELLSCTTCGACSERCPVSIRHVPLILTLRQGMIAENNLEPQLARTLANLQAYRNPWGYPAKARSNWAKGLKIAEAERKGAG